MTKKQKLYTIGEIFREKLMLNKFGKPYGDKSAVAKMVNLLEWVIIETNWGPAKMVPLSEIKKHNARIKTFLLPANTKQQPHAKVRGK